MIPLEDLRQRLIDSRLQTAAAVDEMLDAWRAETGVGEQAAGEEFAAWLVDKERLTDFQSEALLAGQTGPFQLGPYRVSEHLAVGRLGGVFRAVHEEFEQPVSLKIFPAALATEPEKVARVGREARILAELNHQNVIRSFHVGRANHTYYVVLEELHGEPLAARLQREGPLPYRLACRLVRDIARGLEHLHANQVLHRDLRPEHVWLAPGDVPKIMEFGAARDALAYLDELPAEEQFEGLWPDVLPGHYDYMAPEQALEPDVADPRGDIYSAGCVLYHCLTGQPPFVAAKPLKMALLHAMRWPARPRDLVPDLPVQVEQTLWAMLAKDPAQRFQKAGDVAYALDQYVDHEAEATDVHVVDVSSEYLDWVRSTHPREAETIPEESVGVTPELTNFLNWLDARQARRRARRAKQS